MNQNDLRVIKTEQHIEQAFLALLQQKPYRAITVQDILDTAAINRSTFYRHYASKEALAEKMVSNFRQVYEKFLIERFSVASQENLLMCLEQFWAFIHAQKQRILAFWQIKTPNIHLYDDMYALIKQNYIEHAKRHGRPGDLDFQGHTYAGIILNNLSYCLQQDQQMSLEDIRSNIQLMMQTASIQ